MSDENKDDYVMVFEAPKIEPPEFRLYYNKESGRVLFYTCEKPEGSYIVIDSLTFACARHDIIVQDGKITTAAPAAATVVSKLVLSDEGIKVLKEDVSIIVTDDTNLETQTLEVTQYEL